MPNDRKEDRATATPKTFPAFIFNRVEFAGALGDLGTLLADRRQGYATFP